MFGFWSYRNIRIRIIMQIKYSEILRKNQELGISLNSKPLYNIHVLSNIITSQLNDILEYNLRIESINAKVFSGNYDKYITRF